MPTVTFIIGLCGSGKSTLAAKMGKAQGIRVFEDFFDACFQTKYTALLEDLHDGKDCVVVEISCCLSDRRTWLSHKLNSDIPHVQVVSCYHCTPLFFSGNAGAGERMHHAISLGFRNVQ